MTSYGFLIDQRKCIGCHACTTACKAENDVPVGSFRTWVKYVERGTFPAVRRHFAVLRCNHCANAPCVTICPVNALEKRADGIVDLDRDACIGCKGCMQACPYDAIYLNEDSGAAEKCHFCAHRVERGLEPACVVVCPERAIVAGDLDDPKSEIRELLSQHTASVRKPEQGTRPKLWYLGVDSSLLAPTEPRHEDSFLWSERAAPAPEGATFDPNAATRVALDVSHPAPWGWKVGTYLWTKAIAAGAAMLAPFALGLDRASAAPEWIALAFLAATTFLLVEDLARPLRFYRILTRPNWKSWLVRGTVVLMAFGGAVSAALAARLVGADKLADAIRWAGAPLGVAAAAYSGFLFAQCEGRDFWQSRLRAPHLAVEAAIAGAAVFVLLGARGTAIDATLAIGVVLHAALLAADLLPSHGGVDVTRVRELVLRGAFARRFWTSVAVGIVVPLAALSAGLPVVAAIAALAGLLLYGLIWVRAGQAVPLS
ncbi:MAG TPA: 4Fe-4S dicluster domain-containing protein [Planctomycetota bacterium]|nr:4Fe-4S dicluster domain-containing protein [Planctomycetota bacterium]